MKLEQQHQEKSLTTEKINEVGAAKKYGLKTFKFISIFVFFLALSQMFALLSTVNGTDIPDSYFSSDMPAIIGLFNSEFFMGMIFVITLSVFVYVLYLLWQLHEIAVHRSEKIESKQANLVFALSLCGLFLHKGWWVLAVIIAFTNWVSISQALSTVIQNGIAPSDSDQRNHKSAEQGISLHHVTHSKTSHEE